MLLLATEYPDGQGGTRRKYLAEHVMMPYAKLRSLANAVLFLKPGTLFALLNAMVIVNRHPMMTLDWSDTHRLDNGVTRFRPLELDELFHLRHIPLTEYRGG